VVIRPKELSADYISIDSVLQYTMGQIEDIYGVQDIIVYADKTYPFRAPDLVEKMLEIMIEGGFDSVVAVVQEKRTIISKSDKGYEIIDDGFMPAKLKNINHYIGLTGLLTITRPRILRDGKLIGNNIGVYAVEDKVQAIQVQEVENIVGIINKLNKIFIKKEKNIDAI
jgi:CMP-N-acetylneuraminic acid synthetase